MGRSTPRGRLLRAASCAAAVAVLALSAWSCAPARVQREPDRPPPAPRSVLLVSLDGFRPADLDRPEVVHLRRLAESGIRAEGLVPVFPSKTFPSHYSLVTGLPPGRHGIVFNTMRDPELGEFRLGDRAAVEDPRWWGGEPIWVTAERQGLAAATLFWPGSETAIGGVRPGEWRRFDTELPLAERVETVLGWLARPAAERPRLVTLYFEEPNDTAHRYGPDAPETARALAEVDARIGDLLAGLERLAPEVAVDLVVVSDHGMADVSSERMVLVDDFVDLEPGELLDDGSVLQLFPRPGRVPELLEALRGAHPRLTVYGPGEAPAAWGLGESPRVPPILGVTDVGWQVTVRDSRHHRSLVEGTFRGDHGQDPADPRMHGIFLAAGPSFRQGVRTGRVDALDLYPLLAELLGVAPAPHEGDPGRWRGLRARPSGSGASRGGS